MEALQEAYLRAVAAAAGCVVTGRPEIDEGVDISLRHTSTQHTVNGSVAHLDVQMKATSTFAGKDTDYVSAKWRKDRYNDFTIIDPTIDRIVIILSLPTNQAHWTYLRPKALTVHYCAYWVNLAGLPEATIDEPVVIAPKLQPFDDIALCDMMERIGQGGSP